MRGVFWRNVAEKQMCHSVGEFVVAQDIVQRLVADASHGRKFVILEAVLKVVHVDPIQGAYKPHSLPRGNPPPYLFPTGREQIAAKVIRYLGLFLGICQFSVVIQICG